MARTAPLHYNRSGCGYVIDFVICPQTDSQSYSGMLLHSDHRLVVAKLDLRQLFNVWGCIEKAQIHKHVRYNTDSFVNDPYRAMFHAAMSDSISKVNTNTTASERWTSMQHLLKLAAESTIGKTAATTRRDTPHCSEMAAMSAKQRQLKLWHQNTRNSTTREGIKRQRKTILHDMRRKPRDNAEAFHQGLPQRIFLLQLFLSTVSSSVTSTSAMSSFTTSIP